MPFGLIHFSGNRLVEDRVRRDAGLARDEANDKAIADGFPKASPSARVIQIHHTYHYIFIANEADVLRDIRALRA